MIKTEISEVIDRTISNGAGDGLLTEAVAASVKKYDLKSEYLSERAIKAHLEYYEKIVSAFNKASAEMDGVKRKDEDAYGYVKASELFCMNEVYLHELFFSNVGNISSELFANSLAFTRLQRDWGAFDDWQSDFIACAMSRIGGYVATVWSTFLQKFVNISIDTSGSGVPCGCVPVIVVDVCEHAYVRDFANDRRGYVTAMMRELDWDVIEARFKRVERVQEVMK